MSRARKPDPPPLETDDVKIIAGGTAAWGAALVVLLVLRLAGRDIHTWWITMCVCGLLLGLVGVRYCQRRRDAISSSGGQRA
jgi:hypothetical protein